MKEKQANKAIKAILAGKLAVIPTDTVYGIAAVPDNEEAIASLKAAKGRDADKPIALLASGIDAIIRCGVQMNKYEKILAEKFWPGALTLIMCTNQEVMEGFRVPDLELTRYITEECGGLLRVSSANISGNPPALTAESAKQLLQNKDIAVFVDDGPVKVGVASTVMNVDADGKIKIFREGSISEKIIRAICEGVTEK